MLESIAFTHADFPAPVVPADVLAEPNGERRPVLRRDLEDIAEVDDPPARVRDLDPDRLLAGNRGEDADVGGGQGVGDVVLELGDLADLDARREAELVAGYVRAGDPADDLGLDPEMPEGLDQLRRHLLLPFRVRLGRLPRGAGERARARDPPLEFGIVGDRGAVATLGGELGGVQRARKADCRDHGRFGGIVLVLLTRIQMLVFVRFLLAVR